MLEGWVRRAGTVPANQNQGTGEDRGSNTCGPDLELRKIGEKGRDVVLRGRDVTPVWVRRKRGLEMVQEGTPGAKEEGREQFKVGKV